MSHLTVGNFVLSRWRIIISEQVLIPLKLLFPKEDILLCWLIWFTSNAHVRMSEISVCGQRKCHIWRLKILYYQDEESMAWWRHQMETFSAFTGSLWGESAGERWNPHHKDQWREAVIFYLTCAWTNGWANSRDAGDLRHHSISELTCPRIPWYSNFFNNMSWFTV